MKIGEVCKLTGLTERTVRYYVEKQLIAPEAEIINEREYRNYSEKDVNQLLLIAELRKLFFSIDTIARMLAAPEEIGNILKRHQKDLSEEIDRKQEVIDALKKMETVAIDNVGELVERLRYISTRYNLPECDVKPDFGQFDLETEEEKVILSEQAWKNIAVSNRKKRKRLISMAFIIIGLLICAAVGFKVYSYQNRNVYTNAFIPSIEFTGAFVDENREMLAQFRILEGFYELADKELTARFEGDDAGYKLFNSILTNKEYATVMIEAKMNIKTARKLGVLKDGSIPGLDIVKILSDESLSKEYATISYLQGDMK